MPESTWQGPCDARLIYHHFPGLSEPQRRQVGQLGLAYSDWNARVNVVSRKDIGQLYLRHVLHSMSLAKVLRLQPHARVLDLGTGGGFPGVPLAILFPNTHFTLVDSIAKKVRVVQDVVAQLRLGNVQVRCTRAEKLSGGYDFVVCRAVAPLRTLLHWAAGKVRAGHGHTMANGLLCLKGGDLTEELSQAGRPCRCYPIQAQLPYAAFEGKSIVHVPLGS